MSYRNFKIHIKTIRNHKRLVRKLSFRAGMYKQGLIHDLSKWSLTELKNDWKYADGTKSPIDIERKETSCAPSWLHHFHKNKHHWEYWYDISIGKCYNMPDKYIYEAAIDRISAAMNYQKDKYTDSSAFDYFIKNKKDIYGMGLNNCLRIYIILYALKIIGLDKTLLAIKKDIFPLIWEYEEYRKLFFTRMEESGIDLNKFK